MLKVFTSLFMFTNMLFYAKNSFSYSAKRLKKVIFSKL
ncbi:hypothetical protein X845_2388 [Listeria monocytogenes Lm_1824]|nr:hypothetical protein X845_2388 [Listeria monocytogenes Lm_1824]